MHLYVSADPEVIARHQPMLFGTDRISSAYAAITALPDYAKPSFLLTFNEPNYAHLGNNASTSIVHPATAASLWPQLMKQYGSLGIQLIAPSPINCIGDELPQCGLCCWLADRFPGGEFRIAATKHMSHEHSMHIIAVTCMSIQLAESTHQWHDCLVQHGGSEFMHQQYAA